MPLRPVFRLAYRGGLAGQGALTIGVGREGRRLSFNGRNLQFCSLYMPEFENGYESETFALIDVLAGPEAIFYDIGANWGYFAIGIAAREGFAGHVHAFEPEPDSFRDLEGLVKLSGLGEKITGHEYGVSDQTAPASIVVEDGLRSGLATVMAVGRGRRISLTKLDDLAIAPPDIMKLDVEDHETQAILGARRVISLSKPHIIFESAIRRRSEVLRTPFDLLSGLGYVFFCPAWQVTKGRYSLDGGIRSGEWSDLSLVPLTPEVRFLFRDLLNVFACHRDRLKDLKKAFQS